MAYCTNAQVASEFKNITFSSTTSVTDTEVDRFIEEADAEINGKLSNKYETPITGSTSLLIVRQISILLVSQRVKDILAVKSGVTESNQQTGGKRLDTIARQMLKDILDEKILLTDATLLESSAGVESYTSSNDVPFYFERGTEQW